MKKTKINLPEKEKVAKRQLKSMKVKVWEDKGNFVFEFRPEIISEIRQLGFILEVLEVGGGELPLPALADHIDKQAALEAYWSAAAERARYKLQLQQDKWDRWYNKAYMWAFDELKLVDGVPKPTAREIEAKIYKTFSKKYDKKKEKLREFEYNYRLLCNVCHASIVTKGKMLQSLRNILQGSNADGIEVKRTEITDVGIKV